ncbi:NUDIX domain-containing protein [Streptomyces angustmyceticus]|uniref:NUDIX domain-containing protein n=1 Tax=Streptomyces angustmyceticus TaxID=285578 RepID=UPI001CBB2937|nr:NUDIX domain-containing protein [Streptomyces angustmyceticus]
MRGTVAATAAGGSGNGRGTAAAVVTDANRVLLVRRKPDDFMGGLWEVPSGHVDAGESWAALAGDLPGVTDGVREVLACV